MNNRAQSGDLLSIGYFLFILILIAVPIFLMVNVVFGQKTDVRSADASILVEKVSRCLEEHKPDVSIVDINYLQGVCGFDLKDRRFVVSIYDSESTYFSYGDSISCGLYDLGSKNSQYSKCYYSTSYLSVDGDEMQVYVLAGSNLEESNE